MLTLVTAATGEAVSVLEARNHCRASDVDDDVLSLYTAAALQLVQDDTGRSLTTETWCLSMPSWGCRPIILPRAPLIAVTQVRYWSADGVDSLLPSTAYQVEAPSGPRALPGRICLAPAQSWPDLQTDRADAVRVTFTAGYGVDPKAVPAPLRAAALLMIGSMYEFREADAARALTENPAVARLLGPYRVHWI